MGRQISTVGYREDTETPSKSPSWLRRRVRLLVLIAIPPIAGLAFLTYALVSVSKHATQSLAGCATSNSAFLSQEELSGFVVIVDESVHSGTTLSSSASSAPNSSSGRLVGHLNSKSLGQPYRAQEDALAHSLNYTVGKFPFVPLSGQIVTDTPGLLEVYESHFVYGDEAVALATLQDFRASAAPGGGHVVAAPVLDDIQSDHEVAVVVPPVSREKETSVRFAYAIDGVYVVLSFQGGDATNIQLITPLAKTSWSSLARACNLES